MLGPVKLSEIKSMPPLKTSLIRLAELITTTDADIEDFINVIKFDPALTLTVLKWANSIWSQSHSKITDIQTAVIRVGAKTIVNLCLGNHLSKSMSQTFQGYELLENELWRHSTAASLAVENMTNYSKQPIPEGAFAAALIHDIGKIILNRYLKQNDLHIRLHQMMYNDGMSFIQAEQAALGTNHAIIGAELARQWKLPAMFEETIANHHNLNQHNSLLLDAVQVGNAIAKLIGRGLGIEALNLEIDSQSAERLGLTSQAIQACCIKTVIDLEETESLWNLN